MEFPNILRKPTICKSECLSFIPKVRCWVLSDIALFCDWGEALQFTANLKPHQIKLTSWESWSISINLSDWCPFLYLQTFLCSCLRQYSASPSFAASVSEKLMWVFPESLLESALFLPIFLPPSFFSPSSSSFCGRSARPSVALCCAAVKHTWIFHRSPLWWSRGNTGPH